MRWIGGIEGADHVNGRGLALSMARDGGHLARLDADYRRLRRMGFDEVRESVGWRDAEPSTGLDLSSVHARMRAARRHGLDVRWTLMHYGTPEGVDLFDTPEDDFVARFAAFCAAVAGVVSAYPSVRPHVYTPVNEISFLAWAATSTGLIHPHLPDHRRDASALKRRLVRAGVAGCHAIRRVDARALMMWVEPLVHV
ncbi:MAG: hypothetical protein ABW193_09500, partial [Luteibacter sp.]